MEDLQKLSYNDIRKLALSSGLLPEKGYGKKSGDYYKSILTKQTTVPISAMKLESKPKYVRKGAFSNYRDIRNQANEYGLIAKKEGKLKSLEYNNRISNYLNRLTSDKVFNGSIQESNIRIDDNEKDILVLRKTFTPLIKNISMKL